MLDWVHHPTAVSEDIEVFATIFPQVSLPTPELLSRANQQQDHCRLVFSERA